MPRTITPLQLDAALALRDLSDPAAGPHAMQLVAAAITEALAARWRCPVVVHRAGPVVTVAENYELLGYPPDAATRDARYTRSLDDTHLLPSHTSAVLPGSRHRTIAADHPYTDDGLEVVVLVGEQWVELLECGLAGGHVLRAGGLDPERWSGLALGLGLDRALMLRKGIGDIRLLRSDDPRVAAQMQTLDSYQEVSSMPPTRRDLSIAVAADISAEELGDRVRDSLGPAALESVEEVAVVSETPGERLPRQAIDRIGLLPGQKNVLLRLVLRHPTRTLTAAQANRLRDQVYAAVHEGSAHQWAS